MFPARCGHHLKDMDGYEVVRQLGKGGMGTAYCVRRSDGDGGFLALKQVACRNTSEGNDALREAKTLQALTHKNVVRYHDVFLHMDAGLLQVCTVMEFCRSGDLAAHLAQLSRVASPSTSAKASGGCSSSATRSLICTPAESSTVT